MQDMQDPAGNVSDRAQEVRGQKRVDNIFFPYRNVGATNVPCVESFLFVACIHNS